MDEGRLSVKEMTPDRCNTMWVELFHYETEELEHPYSSATVPTDADWRLGYE